MALSALQKARYAYTPKLPPALRGDVKLACRLALTSSRPMRDYRRDGTLVIGL